MTTPICTRRLFVQRGLALLAAAPTVPAFINQTLTAITLGAPTLTQAPSGKDDRILVVVQLAGGNDGLNMVVPYADDAYHRARPELRLAPDTVLKLDDYVGLHPNLAPLKALYDAGNLSVVQGVGYPNPNRSHFRSTDIWASAQPENEQPTTGWVGRYFDNACSGSDPHVGVSISDTLPLAMRGNRVTPLTFERPDNYRYRGPDPERFAQVNRLTSPASQPVRPPTDELDFLHRTALDAQLSSDEIRAATTRHKPDGKYPADAFGQGLKTIAALIAAGLPTRVYYVSLNGFDTHAQQRGRHDQLMGQLAQGLSAFRNDLAAQGNADRVLVMTFSEFGRRVQQNASNGTDHGAAAPMLLMGPQTAGIVGKHPSLTELDQGDLRFGLDFRGVYATILEQWLKVPSKPILGGQFAPVRVL